ncbi:hypothetical protein AB833_02870 [Chromatiales bacterium (ex Bugula neritina AB1)]|nr:hypothetical protein AB833_02870 [Chromatiales bacterium (ex Bugula neritina AB1)]
MVLTALTKTGKWLFYLVAALVILVALLAAFVRLAVFYGDDYSEQLASLVSGFVGSPVQIGETELLWNGFDASARLDDVRILSEGGMETLLVLPSLELELNVRDMLIRQKLSARSVQLKNLSLVVAYEGQGKLKVRGYGISQKSAGLRGRQPDADIPSENKDNQSQEQTEAAAPTLAQRGHSALSWLFNADRIAILDSDITLTDVTRGKEYKADRVNIRAFNKGDRHQIRVTSALPDANGQISTASFDFTGNANNINQWKGEFYIDARSINLDEISDIWLEQSQTYSGRANLQSWGQWQGTRVNSVRTILDASNLAIELPATATRSPVALKADTVGLDLDWNRTDSGWSSLFNRFDVGVGEDTLPLGGLNLNGRRDGDGVREIRVAGPDLSYQGLRVLSAFAAPFTAQDSLSGIEGLSDGYLRNWLFGVRLGGEKSGVSVVKADVEQLYLKSFGKFPGVRNLSANIEYLDGFGSVTLPKQTIDFLAPMAFDEPLPSLDIGGEILFQGGEEKWTIATNNFALGTLDLATILDLSLVLKSTGQKLLNLNSTIQHVNLAKLRHYYPTSLIKPQLLRWLKVAIVDGDVVRGKISVSGDLSDFSPANGKGRIDGDLDLVNSTLKFRTDWPAATQMDGNLSFNARSMRGRVYRGKLREASFSDARLHIANFRIPVLDFQTNAIGPLADMLEFVQSGPLAKKVGVFLGDSRGSGTSRLALDLQIPLRKGTGSSFLVDGSIGLKNAQISAKEFGLDLEFVTGELNFNNTGVQTERLRARYLGVPIEIQATQKRGRQGEINSIVVEGPVAVASVLNSYNIPLTDSFEGLSDWEVRLNIGRATPKAKLKVELIATSDLDGTAIKLPLPLRKSAKTLLQARVYRDFSHRDKDWWIEIPGLAKARVRVSDDQKLEAMAVALGGSDNTVLPWRGIAVHGDAGQVDALGWIRFGLELGESDRDESSSEAFPLFAKVNMRALKVGTRNMGEAVYIAYRDGTHQVHRLENSFANGEMLLRKDPLSNEPIIVNLDVLDREILAAIGTASEAEPDVTNRPLDPRKLPPLDMSVKELKWDNWRFARVAVRTQPAESGMSITALTARQKELRVSGSGRWEINDQGGAVSHTTTIDLNATFDDVGNSISAMGGGSTFADGEGEAALSLSWPSAAYKPDLPDMTGQLFFSVRDGRILSVEPGAGRILGLFALQALPRRLTLDFRDLVSTGLEYRLLSGNFAIANGLASSQNLLLTGPVAEILVLGDTDFVNQTYNQSVDVLPRVSGALPIIGVLSGGPAAGVTALVADGLLKGLGVNLDEIGRRRFTLQGSWDEPIWETVNLHVPGPEASR